MNKTPLSEKVKRVKYLGANPFTDSQARNQPITNILKDFYPTSVYWSRFNRDNEILVGTRGSGKTILLRMLCASHYWRSTAIASELESKDQYYFGIRIPLRLRLLNEVKSEMTFQAKRERFNFIFNCVAIGSLLDELEFLLRKIFLEQTRRLLKVRILLDGLSDAWRIPLPVNCTSIDDFKIHIDNIHLRNRRSSDFSEISDSSLCLDLLEPILGVLDFLADLLEIDRERINWLACFDEAEYLDSEFQPIINTLLRSETSGLTIKIATLPFHWRNLETEKDGGFIRAGGDDFAFVPIDYGWKTTEYDQLINSLFRSRLEKTNIFSFDELEGEDVFKRFLGEEADNALAESLARAGYKRESSAVRIEVIQQLKSKTRRVGNWEPSLGQIKKFEPIHILRLMYRRSRQGNRKIPRLSGQEITKRVSQGNVRRFIQLCDMYFECARVKHLNPTAQHAVVAEFSDNYIDRSNSVHRDGFVLKEFLDRFAAFLGAEMHGDSLKDVGLEFTISAELLNMKRFADAIEAGISHSYIFPPDNILDGAITEFTKLRLANVYAAKYWLPMRAGSGSRVTSLHGINANSDKYKVLSESDSRTAIDSLQLSLFDSMEGADE